MDYLQSITYGLIQGLTEFLPVSSSGHLALLPKFIDFQDPGVSFDLFMHVGTAMAIVFYFHKDLRGLIYAFGCLLCKRSHPLIPWVKNFIYSNLSCLVVVLVLMPIASVYARSAILIGLNLIVFGILLYCSDKSAKHHSANLFTEVKVRESVLVGVAQAIAIFPGVSRSGSTITMGRVLGVGRENIARYSFLLSLPIIFAGALEKLLFTPSDEFHFQLELCLLGVSVSFVVGFLTIHYFLKLISRIPFSVFLIYRLILGGLVIYWGIQ